MICAAVWGHIKTHWPAWWQVHVDICGFSYHLSHYIQVCVLTATKGHINVQGPASTGVWIVFHGASYHGRPCRNLYSEVVPLMPVGLSDIRSHTDAGGLCCHFRCCRCLWSRQPRMLCLCLQSCCSREPCLWLLLLLETEWRPMNYTPSDCEETETTSASI